MVSKKTDPQGWLVLAIVVVIITIVFAWLIVSLWKDANSPNVIQRCNPGLCKFNLLTGVKTCPNPSDTIGIQASSGIERCTSRDHCQVAGFTCAVQPDQSVDCNGVCGSGNSQCRCVSDPTI